MMTSRLPAAVTKMSALATTSSRVATWKPSIAACSAQIGSTSVMITRAPWPRSDSAQPLPTSPYPQTTDTFPPISTSVARLMPAIPASAPALRLPGPRSDPAQPFPTSPYPQTTDTFPPISTSVARLMPSISECRHPYLLSNFDLVTASFTLIAGNSSEPSRSISYSRCTPVVVSSVTPLMLSVITVHRSGLASSDARSRPRKSFHSSVSSSAADGTTLAPSYSAPLCTSIVASPPSSRIMFGPSASGHVSAWSVHHQYSCRLSPFQSL